ncbi:MAG: hypothetical protein GVY27_02975, partial [Deinococcus-Thermus bacterium]|nr:hypothetical protein [Deinococcota bacterium]
MEIVRRSRSAVSLLVLVVVLATACSTPSDILAPGPTLSWTSRFLYEGGLGWASRRNLSAAQFDSGIDTYADRGYVVVDVDVRPDGLGLAYAFIAHENPDDRDWAVHWDLTSSAYHDLWDGYRAQGLRPLDVEGYLVDGQLRFAGVWIENVEGLAWSSARQMTGAEYGAYFGERRAEGKRPIDIEAYDTPAGR